MGEERRNNPDRARTDDERPSEPLNKREAQDRGKGEQARSPVDSQHVDAPNQQDNERGHKRNPE